MKINSNSALPQFPSNPLPARAFDQPLTEAQVQQQIAAFREHAQKLKLRLSDPYNFFVSFIERFRHLDSHSIPECAFAIGLLLDYHYLGNAVFDSGNLDKLPDFHEVYTLFPELIQHEEWNEKLEKYRKDFINAEMAERESILLCNYPTEQLMNIFKKLTLHKNSRKSHKSLTIAQRMLQVGLCLEKMKTDFDEKSPTLTDQARELIDYMRKIPDETAKNLPADLHHLFWYTSLNAAHANLHNRRNARLFEKLVVVAENNQYDSLTESEQAALKAFIKSLLDQRLGLPPYRFFYHAFLTLETYPNIKPLAPVYFWFLFSAHGQSVTAKRVKPEIFDPKQLFSHFSSQPLSEERTSIGLQEEDYKALDDLEQLFEEECCKANKGEESTQLYFDHKLDLPLCDFIFQRITKTQIYGSSTTSIIGDRRKNAKPLFRGFALIYKTMEQMLDEYAVLLPYRDALPCSAEQANLFYQRQTGVNVEYKIMEYLLEQEYSKPLSAKKRLSSDWCRRITKSAFSPEPEKAVCQCIQDFIVSDTRLSAYAQQGDLQRGYLHTAIYRLALEREAKQLARQFIEECSELFYTPIPAACLGVVWNTLFVCYSQNNDPYQIARLVPQSPIQDVKTLLDLISPDNRFCDGYIICLPTPKIEGENNSSRLFKSIFYEFPGDFIKLIMMDIDDTEKPPAVRSCLRRYAQEIYQTIEKSIFDGIVINWDLLDIFIQLSINNIQTLASDLDKGFLIQMASSYTYFCNQLRELSEPAFPIIFRIICPDYLSNLAEDVIRILCRFVYEDGASTIILSKSKYGLPYSEGYLNFINDLAQNLPPSFVYIESDSTIDLTRYIHIAGICVDIS